MMPDEVKMKRAAIELLYVMLEDTDPGTKTRDLADRIQRTLNFDYIKELIVKFYPQRDGSDSITGCSLKHMCS